MEPVLDILLDALRDTLVLVPFLWLTYLLMEALECKAGERVNRAVRKAGPAGPLVGGVLGVVPQCGFSAVAATLWSGRVVTLGTLVAVLLATSDELLPVFVAEGAPLGQLGKVLLAKVLVGVLVGFALDVLARLFRRDSDRHAHVNELCERAHCGCGHEHGAEEHSEESGLSWASVALSATRHTLQVAVFIFLVTLGIDVLIELVGEQAVTSFMAGNPVASVFAAALVGLVPNCAASVVVTELFLDGTLGSAALLAGSLVSSGIGYLVLFRTNAHAAQNLAVVALMYAVGVVAGLAMLASGLSF